MTHTKRLKRENAQIESRIAVIALSRDYYSMCMCSLVGELKDQMKPSDDRCLITHCLLTEIYMYDLTDDCDIHGRMTCLMSRRDTA
jgi:hypothetical protein